MEQRPTIAETPREALELRRKLLNWWTNPSDAALRWMSQLPAPDDTSDPNSFRLGLISRERHVLRNGDLYLVSDEMTEMARAAALTLPTFALEREDFPSEMGILVFHHAPAVYRGREEHDLVAASWWTGATPGGQAGVFFSWYEDRDGGTFESAANGREGELRAANKTFLPRLLIDNWALCSFGEDFTSIIGQSPLLPHALSALLLMQQPLAAREQASVPRTDRRRASRSGVENATVTVVKLRRLKHAQASGVMRPTEWRHRWIVRGHWRNQWLPSRGVHRPTWISPHIKGPDDKPIKVTEKVNVWAR